MEKESAMSSAQEVSEYYSETSEDILRSRHSHKRLLQNHDGIFRYLEYGLYVLAVVIPLYLQQYYSPGGFTLHSQLYCVVAALSVLLVYPKLGIGRKALLGMSGLFRLSKAWALVSVFLVGIGFYTHAVESAQPVTIVSWLLLSLAAQMLVASVCFKVRLFFTLRSSKRISSVIIGSGAALSHLSAKMVDNVWLDERVVGLCDPSNPLSGQRDDIGIKNIVNLTELLAMIDARQVQRIYVALGLKNTPELVHYYQALQDKQVDIVWVPDIYEFDLLNHCVRELGGLPLICLNETPHYSGLRYFVKTVFDRSIAALLIVLLSPLFLVLAYLVKRSSKGPVIFKQQRDGWDGQTFEVFKFRSMYVHEEGQLVKQATQNDDRITPIGKLLRKTSLDELPQLFNVLFGNMSLVGPRPHAISHNQYYSNKIQRYMARGRVKPGMTGLAQIRGFRGETEKLEDMEARVKSDLEYINAWTPWLDIKILLLTPFTLLSKKAY
ncbi:undecaprenyl-phosphate glucose phosphotransferase [Sessilibacter sp. MAH4]